MVACGNCRIFREKQIQRKFKSGLKSVESTDCRIQKGSPVCHIFTHIEWHMESYLIECGKAAPDSDFTWITEQALEKEYALPTAFKKSVYTKPAIVRNLLTLGSKWSIKFISLLTYIYNRKKIFWRM